MTKLEMQRMRECRRAHCKEFRFCEIHWGQQCSRQGGKRVPRIRRPQEEIFVIVTALNGEIRVRKNPWRSAFAVDI